MEQKKLGNLVPAIGLGLILLVVFITFLRPTLRKNASRNEIQNNQNTIERSAPKMTVKEMFQKISAGENLNILDIRPEEEFQKEHMKNSKNIPAAGVQSALDKGKFFVVLDEGMTGEARNLVADLKDNGFTNVFYLEDGFSGWKNGNYPTVSQGDSASILDQSKVSYISADSLNSAIQNQENLEIIDVRNSEIFPFEHLKNAKNIPLTELEERFEEINSHKKTIVYDNNGTLSFQAAVRLFDLSVFNVFVLSGGLDEWKKKNFEISNQ